MMWFHVLDLLEANSWWIVSQAIVGNQQLPPRSSLILSILYCSRILSPKVPNSIAQITHFARRLVSDVFESQKASPICLGRQQLAQLILVYVRNLVLSYKKFLNLPQILQRVWSNPPQIAIKKYNVDNRMALTTRALPTNVNLQVVQQDNSFDIFC